MLIHERPKPQIIKGLTIIDYATREQMESKKGTRKVVDSVGIIIMGTFPHEGILYHIMTDFKKTYLAKVVDRRFITVGIISNQAIWTYDDPTIFKTADDHYVIFFDNRRTKGYFDIYKNNITIVRKKIVVDEI